MGDKVILKFDKREYVNAILYYSNSYGSSVITPIIEGNQISFVFPPFVSNKIGVVNWKLVDSKEVIKEGSLTMNASKNVSRIETYLGPIFMQAGESNYAHLVSIPLDSLDNPVEVNTKVIVNQQFYTSNSTSAIYTEHLISFKEIYTRPLAGRISMNSLCESISSKELSTEIYAANPVDYQINIQTNHPYADGNQLATFSTSPIKDKYGNLVVDGTFVKFIIRNKNNYLLHANGTTINGIATTKINHPKEEDTWLIQSFVAGMAESNTLQVEFLTAIKDFSTVFSDSNRTIEVGPIKSYMNQLIPDGLDIQLRVLQKGRLIQKTTIQSTDGLGTFILKGSILEIGVYDFEIELGGITKHFKDIKL